MHVQAHVHPRQQPEPSPQARPVHGDGTLPFSTLGVHALERGCSVWLLFVYMQIFVIKTIS
jgi:hypothetical protein